MIGTGSTSGASASSTGVRPALQVGQAISGTICLFGEAAACAGTSHTPVRLRQILGDGQRVPFM